VEVEDQDVATHGREHQSISIHTSHVVGLGHRVEALMEAKLGEPRDVHIVEQVAVIAQAVDEQDIALGAQGHVLG
jgi:hypothetical protein